MFNVSQGPSIPADVSVVDNQVVISNMNLKRCGVFFRGTHYAPKQVRYYPASFASVVLQVYATYIPNSVPPTAGPACDSPGMWHLAEARISFFMYLCWLKTVFWGATKEACTSPGLLPNGKFDQIFDLSWCFRKKTLDD